MLLTRGEPDHIARSNLLNRIAPALRLAAAGRYDQDLAQWMGVPCCPGARLERHIGAERARRSLGLEKGSMRTAPVKNSSGPLLEGCDPLRLHSIFRIPP